MGHVYVYDINIQTTTAFFVRKFQFDGKATPECLFKRGLCFNYCENRARHPVSTTFFGKNNRLNIYKHLNFVWLFNIWGCHFLIYLTKNGSENIIYAWEYWSIAGTFSSVARLWPLSLGQNDRREDHVIFAARGHRTKTAVVHRRQRMVEHCRRRPHRPTASCRPEC